MSELININEYPVSEMLKSLLADKTTKKNIIWATDIYLQSGEHLDPKSEINYMMLLGMNSHELQPRVYKSAATQSDRTKAKAEVFTPCWIVNKMNNHCDEEWFGRPDVFNKEDGQSWIVNEDPIYFPETKHWTDYINSTRLEITCGEAPYLVSRYDTTTGEPIPIERRIGILDRKLRVVNENCTDEPSWSEWALKAYQATYGYEYQGDNLLVARINLTMTFNEYYQARWGKAPNKELVRKIVNVIVWNIWQMDGLTGTIPMGEPAKDHEILMLDLFGEEESAEKNERSEPCRIYDWKANKSITYNSLKGAN